MCGPQRDVADVFAPFVRRVWEERAGLGNGHRAEPRVQGAHRRLERHGARDVGESALEAGASEAVTLNDLIGGDLPAVSHDAGCGSRAIRSQDHVHLGR